MKIYHYTTIETLALILKNKTIRFSRLDTLNDLEEGHISSSGIDVGKLAFVSCWTENAEEAIPLWKIYGKDRMGVRIALEKDMFKDYKWNAEHCRSHNPTRIPIFCDDSEVIMKFPFNDCFKKGGIFVPVAKVEHFYHSIQYVKNVKPLIEDSASVIQDSIEKIDHSMVGRYKNKRWKFEKETRFILYRYPIDILEYLKNPNAETLSNGILNNKFDESTFYDMHLKDDIFDNLEVRLSPSADESHQIIVDSLLKQYAPSAKWKESKLRKAVKLK